jgi:hypothetical protein
VALDGRLRIFQGGGTATAAQLGINGQSKGIFTRLLEDLFKAI